MEEELIYPYDDEYMKFNEATKRYVLTPKFLLDKYGVDMISQLQTRDAQNPQVIAEAFLEEVSDDIYNLIHENGKCNELQDCYIAKCPKMRPIIQKAMAQQYLYSRFNGLLAYAVGKDEQEYAVCDKAYKTLLNSGILYGG